MHGISVAVLTRSLLLIQPFSLSTAPVRNWSSLFLKRIVERTERSGGRCVNRNSWIVNRCSRCLRTRRTQKQRDVASVFRLGRRVSSPPRRVNFFRLKHFMA